MPPALSKIAGVFARGGGGRGRGVAGRINNNKTSAKAAKQNKKGQFMQQLYIATL
jgi:hypothetical protein